jgi:hypothetical protein
MFFMQLFLSENCQAHFLDLCVKQCVLGQGSEFLGPDVTRLYSGIEILQIPHFRAENAEFTAETILSDNF